MLKPMDTPLVAVLWDDPQSSATEVITEDTLDTFHLPMQMETLGWLLRDDDKGVSLANERYYEKGRPHYRGHTFILRSLVRSTRTFDGRGKRPRRPAASQQAAASQATPSPAEKA